MYVHNTSCLYPACMHLNIWCSCVSISCCIVSVSVLQSCYIQLLSSVQDNATLLSFTEVTAEDCREWIYSTGAYEFCVNSIVFGEWLVCSVAPSPNWTWTVTPPLPDWWMAVCVVTVGDGWVTVRARCNSCHCWATLAGRGECRTLLLLVFILPDWSSWLGKKTNTITSPPTVRLTWLGLVCCMWGTYVRTLAPVTWLRCDWSCALWARGTFAQTVALNWLVNNKFTSAFWTRVAVASNPGSQEKGRREPCTDYSHMHLLFVSYDVYCT